MTNAEIINAFLNSDKEHKANNVTTHFSEHDNEMILRKYGTIIAVRKGKEVEVTAKKYSNTTSALTNLIKRTAKEEGFEVVESEKFECGGCMAEGGSVTSNIDDAIMSLDAFIDQWENPKAIETKVKILVEHLEKAKNIENKDEQIEELTYIADKIGHVYQDKRVVEDSSGSLASALDVLNEVIDGEVMAEGGEIKTMADLKAKNKEIGNNFFSPQTMRFFKSKVESSILKGKYFITSEQYGEHASRTFKIRAFRPDGSIVNNPFDRDFASKESAKEYLSEHHMEEGGSVHGSFAEYYAIHGGIFGSYFSDHKMAEGGGVENRYQAWVGEKEEKGYPVFVRMSGYAANYVGWYKTDELAEKKAKDLMKKNQMADGGGVRSEFGEDTDKWFDPMVSLMEKGVDEKVKKIVALTDKDASKANVLKLEEMLSENQEIKDHLMEQIEKVKDNAYKKEFRFQYGGHRGSGGRSSSASELFSMIHQALTYHE